MDMIFPVTEAQQLYKQWQDGKLLDNEERRALGPIGQSDLPTLSFAELLKSTSDLDN